MMMGRDATVVAELTPPGRAAVAVVIVAGPNAMATVRRFFSPATEWSASGLPIGRIMLGRWGGEQGEELIVCRRSEVEFEIHCHGGAAAAAGIVEQLVAVGCARLRWREWLSLYQRRMSCLVPIRKPSGTVPNLRSLRSKLGLSPFRRRFSDKLFGESESQRDSATSSRVSLKRGLRPAIWSAPIDSTAFAAITALAEAPTARTAAVLLDQYHGALSSAVEAARAALTASNATRASQIIDNILAFRELGLHLATPWQVVIAGPPNVGKSSLLNAIAGYQRAIVSPRPGTTRDVVTIATAINGWPVQIADTAGLRETHDEFESAGVALADAAVQQADLVILVSDASAGVLDASEILTRRPSPARVMHAVNKIDLIQAGDDASPRRAPNNPARHAACADCPTQFVSALTGSGIADLLVAMDRLLVPTAPPDGAAVPFTLSQLAGLEAARAAIERADFRTADAVLAAVLAGDDDGGMSPNALFRTAGPLE